MTSELLLCVSERGNFHLQPFHRIAIKTKVILREKMTGLDKKACSVWGRGSSKRTLNVGNQKLKFSLSTKLCLRLVIVGRKHGGDRLGKTVLHIGFRSFQHSLRKRNLQRCNNFNFVVVIDGDDVALRWCPIVENGASININFRDLISEFLADASYLFVDLLAAVFWVMHTLH